MTNIDDLNPMQKAFCDEYLKCGNKAKAARGAGYSAKTASATAVRLLKNVKIQKYIAERQKQIEDARIADVAEVMRFLTSVMRGEVKDQFDLDAPLSERTNAAKEILKRNMDNRRMDIELTKLEAAYKDNTAEEVHDNFMDALNATACEVWTDDE